VMYGNPLVSGHGPATNVFTTRFLWANLRAHAKWMAIVHTPVLFVLAAAGWWLGSRSFARAAWVLFAVVSAPYMFYAVAFDDWEMLRFLMPGFVFLLMTAADGAEQLFVRYLPRAAAAIAPLILVAAAFWASYAYLQTHGVFQLWYAESKYPATAAWISSNTKDG